MHREAYACIGMRMCVCVSVCVCVCVCVCLCAGVAEDSGDEEAGPHQQTNTKQRSGKHKETPLGTDAANKGKAQGKGKGQQSNGDATNNAELELLLMDDEEIR